MKPYLLISFITILLMSIFVCQGSAQHYEIMKLGEKQHFNNSNGYLRGIRIDSVKTAGTDSIYYPFKTDRNAWPDERNGSWVGSKCIKRADGTYLIDNADNDTIVIRSQAAIGDTWVFYSDTGVRYFMARVTGIDTGNVLGMADSIKTISITAYDASGLLTGDTLSNFELKISQHYGMLQLFDFYNFPYRFQSFGSGLYYYNDVFLKIVTGIPFTSFPHGPVSCANSLFRRVAIHNPTRMEIYDYAAGDAFGTGYTNGLNWTWSTSNGNSYDSVLQRTVIDPYHVQYQIYSRSEDYTHYPGSSTTSGYTTGGYSTSTSTGTADTSVIIIYPETMPEEYLSTGSAYKVYYYLPSDTSYCTTSTLFGWDVPVLFEGCDNRQVYKSGFGLISEASYSAPWPDDIGCHGTYSKSMGTTIKGGVLCVGYYVPNRVSDLNKVREYQLYPNPAGNEITLTASSAIGNVAIYDLLGRREFAREYNDTEIRVDISGLPRGMYLIFVEGGGVKKFMKY